MLAAQQQQQQQRHLYGAAGSAFEAAAASEMSNNNLMGSGHPHMPQPQPGTLQARQHLPHHTYYSHQIGHLYGQGSNPMAHHQV